MSTLTALLHQTATQPVVTINAEQLSLVLDQLELVSEQDTGLRGAIRILQHGGETYVQETTDTGAIIIRRMASAVAAQQLVEQRLQSYERMWDGCGCRIDYFA